MVVNALVISSGVPQACHQAPSSTEKPWGPSRELSLRTDSGLNVGGTGFRARPEAFPGQVLPPGTPLARGHPFRRGSNHSQFCPCPVRPCFTETQRVGSLQSTPQFSEPTCARPFLLDWRTRNTPLIWRVEACPPLDLRPNLELGLAEFATLRYPLIKHHERVGHAPASPTEREAPRWNA
jgi:hypothetical protein